MFTRLLGLLGTAAIRAEIQSTVTRIRLRAVLTAALAAMWVLALGFALGALTLWLSAQVGAIAACLILAAGFVAIALGLHVAVVTIKRRATPLAAVLSQALAPLKQAAEEGGPAEHKPAAETETTSFGAILFLAAVGYVLGRSLTNR